MNLDTQLHLTTSALLTLNLYALGAANDLPIWGRLTFALAPTLAIGGVKEVLFDRVLHGTPSWLDFLADVVGALAGAALGLTLDGVMRW